MTITRDGNTLRVGTDFVDAAVGQVWTSGKMTVPGIPELTICSTQDVATTDQALRAFASREGRTVKTLTLHGNSTRRALRLALLP